MISGSCGCPSIWAVRLLTEPDGYRIHEITIFCFLIEAVSYGNFLSFSGLFGLGCSLE